MIRGENYTLETSYRHYIEGRQVHLSQVIRDRRMWPTPTSSDGTGGPGSSGRDGGDNLRTAVNGQLNPTWVEWLMGFPEGWTDLED
jgi:hypothetical protein